MKGDVRRAAHGDRDRERVPQGRGGDDVARLDALPREGHEAVDELLGELVEPARIVGGRRHHVQRLHADHGDEGLHGVVGEHAAAAALARAGVERHLRAPRRVRVARHLEGRDQVDALPGRRISPGPDRPVRHEHRRLVALEHRRERADGGLVARDDRDQALHVVGVQVRVDRVVRELAADQGEPHAVGAVQLSVGHAEGVGGRDQAHREVVAPDPRPERRLDRVDLAMDAEVALAVTEVPDHGPDRLMDLERILSEKARRADPLHVAPRVLGDESISRHPTLLHRSRIRTVPVGSRAVMRMDTTRMRPNAFSPGKTHPGAGAAPRKCSKP